MKNIVVAITLLLFAACTYRKDVEFQKELSFELYAESDSILDIKNAFQNKFEKETAVTIPVDMKKADKNLLYLADCIEDYRVIKLETTNDNYIRCLDEVFIVDDRIFCLDLELKTVFVFNINGGYIDKASAIGRGPGEYQDIGHIAIDKVNSLIKIYDVRLQRILNYDFDAKFVSAEKPKFIFQDYFYTDSVTYYYNRSYGNYHLNEGRLHHLLCRDKSGKLKFYSHPFSTDLFGLTYRGTYGSVFHEYNNEVLYFPVLSDTIYSIKGNSVEAKYRFDFMGDGLNQYKPFDRRFYYNFTEKKEQKQYQFLVDFLETDSLVYLNLKRGDFKGVYGVYEKTTGKTNLGYGLPLNYVKAPIWANPRWTYGNYFIGYTHAYRVLDYHESIKKTIGTSKIDKEILHLMENIKEDDNPVLVLYKINGVDGKERNRL